MQNSKYLNVLKEMQKNQRKNGGLPVVACILDKNYEIIVIESNKSIEYINGKEDRQNFHIKHAEWLCLNNLTKNQRRNLENFTLFINITPCDRCSQRLIDLKSKFQNIYFLQEKYQNKDILWKNIIPNLRKYEPSNKEEEIIIEKIIKEMESANEENRKKTIEKKGLSDIYFEKRIK